MSTHWPTSRCPSVHSPRGRLYCCVTSYRLNRQEGKLALSFQSFRLVAPDTALGSFLQGPRATGSDRNKSMSFCVERSTGEPTPGSPGDLARHAMWREFTPRARPGQLVGVSVS